MTPAPTNTEPTVACVRCNRKASCMTMKDGTVYKPFAWFYPAQSSMTGYCPQCLDQVKEVVK